MLAFELVLENALSLLPHSESGGTKRGSHQPLLRVKSRDVSPSDVVAVCDCMYHEGLQEDEHLPKRGKCPPTNFWTATPSQSRATGECSSPVVHLRTLFLYLTFKGGEHSTQSHTSSVSARTGKVVP